MKILSCCSECVVAIFCAWLVVTLSNVVLMLGVRALTEEEHLYVRLCRLGKYFSTGEGFCTYYKVI
jgi:hypothetical protein